MHKNVELLIGRLATDPHFRARFARDAHGVLCALVERGFELTGVEVAALAALDLGAVDQFASVVDRRLRHAVTYSPDAGEQS